MSNNHGKHLDLVFSNNNNIYIEKSSSNVVPCDSYHPALYISLSIIADTPSLDKSHTYFNFRKTSYPEILNFLNSFNWPETINNLNVDSAANALYDTLHSSILQFVPKNRYVKSKFPSWFSKDLKSIVHQIKKHTQSIGPPISH